MRSGGSRVHQQQQPQNQSQQQGGAAGSAVVSEQALRRRQQEEADKRAIEQALQAKKEAGNKHLGKLNLRIKESMRFLDGVDRDLNLVSETKRTKTRRAFEDWNANVHGKINHRISVALNKISSKELHEKKLADYQTFIDITNRKPVSLHSFYILHILHSLFKRFKCLPCTPPPPPLPLSNAKFRRRTRMQKNAIHLGNLPRYYHRGGI